VGQKTSRRYREFRPQIPSTHLRGRPKSPRAIKGERWKKKPPGKRTRAARWASVFSESGYFSKDRDRLMPCSRCKKEGHRESSRQGGIALGCHRASPSGRSLREGAKNSVRCDLEEKIEDNFLREGGLASTRGRTQLTNLYETRGIVSRRGQGRGRGGSQQFGNPSGIIITRRRSRAATINFFLRKRNRGNCIRNLLE